MEIISRVKNKLHSKFLQYRDFRTNRKIIVFESDDWGSIRMSNKKDRNELLKLGYSVDKRPYERFDTLESAEDIEALLSVLSNHMDSKGCHPILTINMLMANPDFEKMKIDNYDYSYEPINETYLRYWGNTKVIEYMKEGYSKGLLMPQSHGREHFNICEWVRSLKSGDNDMLTAFNYKMCGIAPKLQPEKGNPMMQALLATDEASQRVINDSVKNGLKMFHQFWGFDSNTFVAPCYLWNESVEQQLSENGVKLIQTGRKKKAAFESPESLLYTGQKNKFSQLYSVRNCEFEPSMSKREAADLCLSQIEQVFRRQNMAIISTHRINYVSGISESNRQHTLSQLDELLKQIIKKYPSVEFLSSDRLIDILSKENV